MKRLPRQLLFALALLLPAVAHAHEEQIENLHELGEAWVFEPGICIPLILTAWLYVQGIWRNARGIKAWEIAAFIGGWVALVVALVSPIHPWGRALFSVHMVQHEILMLVAAPLLVLGQPVIAFLRALPSSWASSLARLGNAHWWQNIWRFITNALVAFLLHAVILWAWHAPKLMSAVIDNEWVHAAQHLSFLLSALLFW